MHATGLARELLQAAEVREFSLEAPDPVSPFASLDLGFFEAADRVLLVVLDARPVPEATLPNGASVATALLQRLGTRLPSENTCVVEVLLKEPENLYLPAQGSHLVRLGLADLDERDLRVAFLTLYVLHQTLRLLAPGVDTNKLFFSHAKRDGVPLTTAARDWLNRVKGFQTFYDTEDLDLSGDVTAQLSSAVASAIVIVFRSDAFDDRYWCQKEVLWAEQNARPVVIVDARWQIEHSPSVINFDSMPGVRIPDGSVVRIFTAAMIEALRVELFKVRVENYAACLASTAVVPIPRSPSILALEGACSTLRKMTALRSGDAVVVYPNPSLPETLLAAANALAGASLPSCRVVSLDEFRLLS